MKQTLLVSLGVCALFAAATAGAQGTKWHPGHYVMLNGSAKDNFDEHLSNIDEIRNDAAIQGVMVRFWWHDLEPTLGRYDFSLIDGYLAALKKLSPKKRLVVRIMDRKFDTVDRASIVPDYLRTDPVYNGGIVRSRKGYVSRLWEAPVMGRLMKLYEAIGRRYDSNPLFEGAFTEETTLGFDDSNVPAGYTKEKLEQQWVRFIKAVKPTLPTTNLFLNANWIGSLGTMSDLVQEVRDAGVGAAGSNVVPGLLTEGQSVLDGVSGADYRLEVAIAYGVESGELGGSLGDFTPAQIASYAYNTLKAHYLFWARNTYEGTAKERWDTGILPYLRSKPPLRTRCPNVYGICVSDDRPIVADADTAPPAAADTDSGQRASDGGSSSSGESTATAPAGSADKAAPAPSDSAAEVAPPSGSATPAAPPSSGSATATAPPAPGSATAATPPPSGPPPPAAETAPMPPSAPVPDWAAALAAASPLPPTTASSAAAPPPSSAGGGGGSLGLLEVLLLGLVALGRRSPVAARIARWTRSS
jgi:hypothetical protein